MERDVTGILLAGGKSQRMGQDKRFLVLGEQTLLERGLSVLRLMFKDVLVVIAQDSPSLSIDAPVVRDLAPDCGSLGGLYTGLVLASTPYIFLVGCDMPFLDPTVISQFIKRRATADIIIAKLSGRVHPLHALYSKECLPVVEPMIRVQELKIQDMISRLSTRVRYITEADLLTIDSSGRSFQNINTLEDLEEARGLLGKFPILENP